MATQDNSTTVLETTDEVVDTQPGLAEAADAPGDTVEVAKSSSSVKQQEAETNPFEVVLPHEDM